MDINSLTMEGILEDSVFDELFSETDPIKHDKIYSALLDKAKLLSVLEKFKSRYTAFKKVFKEFEKEQLKSKAAVVVSDSRGNITNFNSDKYPEFLSGVWECDYSGVKTYTMFGEVYACYHPIMPIRRLINIENNKEKMVVAWNKDGYWKEQIFDKSVLFSASKIVSSMAEYGILTSSENAKYLVKYFCDMENMNIREIPVQLSTSRMGWIDNYSKFMPFTAEDIVFDSESAFKSIYESIKNHGSREEFMQLFKEIRKRDRKEPMMCVASSLASVLVEPCGVLPFIFHIYGEAGKGKTLSSMLAAAIWGNPSEDGYLSDPKNTSTVFEVYLDFLNNMPFVCDDMSKLKRHLSSQKNGDFSEFIYFLCSGTGKKRSNINLGVNKVTSWKNCSITNAEKPLTSEISNGGELLRVIEMQTEPGYVFDDGSKGKHTADTLRKNYGFLGQEFIEVIKTLGIKEIIKMHEEFVNLLDAMDIDKEKEGKQVQPMALLLTADKILTDHIVKDGVYLDINYCFGLIRSNKAMSDNERAYEFIVNEVSQYPKRFISRLDGAEPEQRWGYYHEGYILINSNVFSGFAERGNFNKKMFIEWAANKYLAKHNKNRIDLRVKTSDFAGAFICIKMPEDLTDIECAVDECDF